MLLAKHERGVVTIPDVGHIVEFPLPLNVVPVQVPNAQVFVVKFAINGPPEEHGFAFPILGNEVWIGQ